MNKFWVLLLFILFGIFNVQSQSITKSWSYKTAEDTSQVQNDFIANHLLIRNDGRFEINPSEGGEPLTTGDYLYQNNLLVFFFDAFNDSIRKFRISELSDTSLVLVDNNNTYTFTEAEQPIE